MFLQNAPLQGAARTILSEFPNATPDLNLSRYVMLKSSMAFSEAAAQWFGGLYDASQITSSTTKLKSTEMMLSQNRTSSRALHLQS